MIFIDNFIDRIGKFTSYLVLILAILVVYDSLNRYLFSGGNVALQELEWHLFDMIFLLGLSYALNSDDHVRVDIFYSRYTNKTKAIVNLISLIFLILPFVAIILYTSSNFIYLSFLQGEISSDPGGLCCRYVIKGFIFIGFALLGVQSISNIVKNFHMIRGDK
ncbi:MAG TPA: TRAP transporter small permease subunit [Campylobacterales bacterium]|nr:TRAP transporter small permease subunit [Campylobacterales bacterium]